MYSTGCNAGAAGGGCWHFGQSCAAGARVLNLPTPARLRHPAAATATKAASAVVILVAAATATVVAATVVAAASAPLPRACYEAPVSMLMRACGCSGTACARLMMMIIIIVIIIVIVIVITSSSSSSSSSPCTAAAHIVLARDDGCGGGGRGGGRRWKRGRGGGAGDGRDQDEAFIMVRGKCCNKKWKGFRVHLSTANSLGAVQASMHCSDRRGEGCR